MSNEKFRKLIEETIIEASRLISGPLEKSSFLAEVLNTLHTCKNNNYVVSDSARERFRLMGAAAVRQFDSFDFTPEAEAFVSLACDLSKHFSLHEKQFVNRASP